MELATPLTCSRREDAHSREFPDPPTNAEYRRLMVWTPLAHTRPRNAQDALSKIRTKRAATIIKINFSPLKSSHNPQPLRSIEASRPEDLRATRERVGSVRVWRFQ